VIVLDTNVISEPIKPLPDPLVVAWLDRQPKEALYLCAPVLMEVLLGIALLPGGRRKRGMAMAIQALFANFFAERFLAFERQAAVTYASLASRASARGYSISVGRLPNRGHCSRAWFRCRHARYGAVPRGRRSRHQSVEELKGRVAGAGSGRRACKAKPI
jgi:predicted nucleic acid-binding protein